MRTALAFFAALAILPAESPAATGDPGETFFEQNVRPILAKCQKCHGAKKQESGLRLDARRGLIEGGDAGPAIVPGDPAGSLLIQAVTQSGDLAMPPDGRLSDGQIADLKRWVEMGAPWPGGDPAVTIRSGGITEVDRRFWSLRPIADPPVPKVADRSWIQTDVDAFILRKLEEKGISPAPLADRRTLIRRATFDLTGLPPTPREVADFLEDHAPGAFARVVDRLLASPRYGERWGRHWLDVARYADTAGETADFPVREAYLYRDYVISAFNNDKPYDQFVREQVAGDILAEGAPPGRYAEMVTATGFLAISRRFGFDPENYHHLTIQDSIDTLGQAVLGLSLGCARCHNHKFDPITAADYYALYGIFDSTRYAFPGSEEKKRPRDFVPLVPPAEAASGKPAAVAYGVTEGAAHDARIQKRGEPTILGDVVPRRFLEVLGGDLLPPDVGSGRLALAGWLTRESNPLTARVMVNRVWQHHFGRGLVATENDFGRRGQAPTHPDLLDFLARRFRDGGWSIKSLHRAILLSSTYQTSGRGGSDPSSLDPDAAFLSRFPRRRLDAEEIRDAMLVASGTLDLSPAGPHPFPPVETWAFTQHNPFSAVYESKRRSVYLMTQRLKRHPYLALFDGPDTNSSTARRVATTVPTQSLFFMNDPFVHEQSSAMAGRILGSGPDDHARLAFAFEIALSRPPATADEEESRGFLDAEKGDLARSGLAPAEIERRAWSALARTLLSRNEFVFVD